jgi:hypothetical protein
MSEHESIFREKYQKAAFPWRAFNYEVFYDARMGSAERGNKSCFAGVE